MARISTVLALCAPLLGAAALLASASPRARGRGAGGGRRGRERPPRGTARRDSPSPAPLGRRRRASRRGRGGAPRGRRPRPAGRRARAARRRAGRRAASARARGRTRRPRSSRRRGPSQAGRARSSTSAARSSRETCARPSTCTPRWPTRGTASATRSPRPPSTRGREREDRRRGPRVSARRCLSSRRASSGPDTTRATCWRPRAETPTATATTSWCWCRRRAWRSDTSAAGRFVAERTAAWSALGPALPVPMRDPIAEAVIAPGAVGVGSTDRGGLRLTPALAVDAPLVGLARVGRRRRGLPATRALGRRVRRRARRVLAPTASRGPGWRCPRRASTRSAPRSSPTRWATHAPWWPCASRAAGCASRPASAGGVADGTFGAQLAVGDLDQDGAAEIATSADLPAAALRPPRVDDAIDIVTWSPLSPAAARLARPDPICAAACTSPRPAACARWPCALRESTASRRWSRWSAGEVWTSGRA